MTYGTIKVDTVTFTDAGIDKSVTLSGLVQNPTFSGNVTVTGTLSGVTVTGTTANFTSGNFTNISGGTHTITSGVFAAGSAASPSITFTGDLNTGIYSPGADQVAISTGGSGRLFIGSTGAVGVGVSDPGYALDVAAADTTAGLGYALRLRANSTAGAAAIQFTNNPVSAEYSVIAGDSSNNLKFLTSGSERLRIASNGQVSIGTSAAKAPLHLFGAGQATASITDAGARGCFLRLSDNSAAAGAGGAILFANVQGDNANSLGFAAIKGLLIDGANNTRGDISFSTRGNNTDSSLTERMRIAADGAVGIGRAPAYTLDVAGSARIGAATGEANLELGAGATGNRAVYIDFVGDTTYTDYGFRILRTNEGANAPTFLEHRGTGDFAFNAIEAAPLIFRTNSSERLRITPAGFVGIGQSTPSTRLHVTDGEFTISTGGNASDAGGIINFSVTALSTFSPMATIQGLLSNAAGTELQGGLGFFTRPAGTAGQTLQRRMTITDAGNVGIGTTSPTAKLTVFENTGTGAINLSDFSAPAANQNPLIRLISRNAANTTTTSVDLYKVYQSGFSIINNDTDVSNFTSFNVGSSERLRITSAGLVGVGTSSPQGKLHVKDGYLGVEYNSGGVYPAYATYFGAFGTNFSSGGSEFDIWNTVGGGFAFRKQTAASTQSCLMYISSAGNVGVGTTSPGAALNIGADGDFWLASSVNNVEEKNLISWRIEDGSEGARISAFREAVSNAPHSILFSTRTTGGAFTEKARIDSSGRLLLGTSSALTAADVSKSKLVVNGDTDGSGYPGRIALNNSVATVLANYKLGEVYFSGQAAGNAAASIACYAESDWNTAGDTTDNPGYLVFSTTADGASSPTERMRITSAGAILVAKTADDINTQGIRLSEFGVGSFCRDAEIPLFVNRNTDDGTLVVFRQAGVDEGSISVSGTTVSYNGAHLSRWSQLPSGAERTEILRGTVLSNIDEMCEWGDEDNEQLNRMKVSDVEGDKNVSGVFQGWDDDDDTYTNDFYCAMTGDFIIRIAPGVTVERGDLLMSAGDGTAKPQGDDIIRSKTVAKITSTNVSCTYDDGSYCVPCVLMAC